MQTTAKRPSTLSTTISAKSRKILEELKDDDVKVNAFIDKAIQNEYKRRKK